MKKTKYTVNFITLDGKPLPIEFRDIKTVDDVINSLQGLKRWMLEDDRLERLYKGDENELT